MAKKRARVMVVAGRFAKFFGVKPVDKIAAGTFRWLTRQKKTPQQAKVAEQAASYLKKLRVAS